MAERTRIDIDAVINTGDSLQKLRELKKAQKEVVAGSAEFNKLAAAIRDTGDALDSAKLGADDLAGSLESAPGPVGKLFSGIKKVELATKSWGVALKAAGIGLLVSTLGLLIGAFSKVEGSTKALEPLFIQLEKTMGGLVQAFTPLLEGFAELAIQILPVVTKGIQNFYGGLVSLFTLLKEAGLGATKIIAGILTQDYAMAKEGLKQLQGAWGKTTERFNQFQDDFQAGYDKQSETEKKLAEEQAERDKAAQEAAKKAEEARKKAFEERLKRMDAEDKMDEALMKKQKAELLLLAQTEQEKLDIERKFAELSNQARLKDLADRMALYDKDSLEYKGLQTEKINVEADYITQQRAFLDQQKKLNDDATKERLEKEKKAKEEERGLRLLDLQQQLEDLDRENQMFDMDFQADLERLAEQRTILAEQERTELQNTDLTEFQKTEIAKKYADLRQKITDNEVQVERNAMEAKMAINAQYIDIAAQFGSLLQQVAGKNKGIAIAGVVVEQAASIAKIVANTAAGIATLTPGLPFTAPSILATKISAGLGIASTIAAASKAISQINATPGGGGGSGGSVSAGGVLPSFSAPSGMAAPQIQTGVQQSPASQIASTIGQAQERPIKAYVVSQDVSSAQALGRRTDGAATFGGG